MIAAWLASGRLKRDCNACELDDGWKKRWICKPVIDEETGKPQPAYRIYRNTKGMRMVLDRCPAGFVDVKTLKAFKLFGHYAQGRFPVAGGVLDQTASGLEAFEVIEHCLDCARRG